MPCVEIRVLDGRVASKVRAGLRHGERGRRRVEQAGQVGAESTRGTHGLCGVGVAGSRLPPPAITHLEGAIGGAARHVAQVVGDPHHVGRVQGRIHLVHHEEGAGPEAGGRSVGLGGVGWGGDADGARRGPLKLAAKRAKPGPTPDPRPPHPDHQTPLDAPEDGEEEGQGRHGLLAPAQRLHVPEALGRGHGAELDPGAEGLVRTVQRQVGLAARGVHRAARQLLCQGGEGRGGVWWHCARWPGEGALGVQSL